MNEDNMVLTDGIIRALQHTTLVANTQQWLINVGANLRSGNGRPVTEFTLPKSRQKDTIFVVAPGASMSQYRDQVAALRDCGTVLMQPTAYRWYHDAGLDPDAIVLVDSLSMQADSIAGAECPVIAPTTVDPRIAAEHETYFFTLYQGDGSARHDGTEDGRYMAHWNHIMHGLHKGALTEVGWVSVMDVTNMAVQIAIDLLTGENRMPAFGGKRVVLVGADRCYWNGYARVPEKGELVPGFPEDRHCTFRGKDTDYAMVIYMYKLYELWRLREAPLLRCDSGVMKEIPHVSMEQIVAGKYPPALRTKRILRDTERFILEELPEVVPHIVGTPAEVRAMAKKVAEIRREAQSAT